MRYLYRDPLAEKNPSTNGVSRYFAGIKAGTPGATRAEITFRIMFDRK